MEVSMQINHNLPKRVPLFHASSHRYNNYKPMMISCQILGMQSEKRTNFYQILSLNSQNVGFDEIKKAYKSMALQYHPDVCTNNNIPLTKEESTQRFIELRKAYETLSDPNSRRIYDCELGLDDPFASRFGGRGAEKRREDGFSREVWERQLHGLRKRSGERMKKRGFKY